MSWLKKIFSSQSSQETKVYYKVEKDKKEEQVIEPKKEERETTSDRTQNRKLAN